MLVNYTIYIRLNRFISGVYRVKPNPSVVNTIMLVKQLKKKKHNFVMVYRTLVW